MDLVRLAYYPFLPEVREAVREAGPGLDAVLGSPLYASVRARAAQRVEGALGEGFPEAGVADERSALMELLSVPVARMLAVRIADKTLLARYAAAEARRVEVALLRGRDAAETADAAAALGIPCEHDTQDETWSLHVADYLRCAPSETDWKLILRPVEKGRVRLDQQAMARLVREALQRRIVAELEAEVGKPMPEPVAQALAPLVERLAPALEQAREAWSTGDFGPVQPALFPPCVKEVFESLKRSENVPHHGRFAFATFLHTVGWNAEQILDYLSSTPNFDREKSRYQIEHVTGEKSVQAYTPPGCATLQTNGVCPLDKRDGLCFKVKHPLSYYRAQMRFRKQDEERRLAKESAGAASGAGPAAPPGGEGGSVPRAAAHVPQVTQVREGGAA